MIARLADHARQRRTAFSGTIIALLARTALNHADRVAQASVNIRTQKTIERKHNEKQD